MKIGLIGEGAIGQYVRETLSGLGLEPVVTLVRAARLNEGAAAQKVASVNDLPSDLDLMIDCAGHSALVEHGPAVLQRGFDLVTVSVGALADPDLLDTLKRAAQSGGARLVLASGAIGALDCLQSARVGGLDEVTYVGRKPPMGWKGSPAEGKVDLAALTTATEHFSGTARQAALEYPKNANVAAAVAMAGTGFDQTKVRLLADPAVTANIHEIHAKGAFGSFSFQIQGNPLPDNPRSSALAAMSVVASVLRERAAISV